MSNEYDIGETSPLKREINGKTYIEVLATSKKYKADALSNSLTDNGHLAEVVSEGNFYLVFFRSKNWN